MKTQVIEARDLPEAWFRCMRTLLTEGRVYEVEKGSFEGLRRLEMPVHLYIENPGTRPLAPEVPAGVPSPTNDKYIEQYYYFIAAPDKGENQYTYGEDMAPQIAEILDRYSLWGPNTNRYCMMCGGRDSLFEYRKENQVSSAHSPCLRVTDLRIEDDTLHFFCYFRSWDLMAGLPSNLGGLQLLKERMAEAMGLKDGTITAFSKGLHLYENSWRQAPAAVGLDPNDTVLKDLGISFV